MTEKKEKKSKIPEEEVSRGFLGVVFRQKII